MAEESIFKKACLSRNDISGRLLPNPDEVRRMKLPFTIVHTQWHSELVKTLLEKLERELSLLGADAEVFEAPGCWEIPLTVSSLLCQTKFAGKRDNHTFICLGVLLKGDTLHFEMVSENVNRKLMDIQTERNIPIVNGVLCCLEIDQAVRRTQGDMSDDLAKSYALTAVQMAIQRNTLFKRNDE